MALSLTGFLKWEFDARPYVRALSCGSIDSRVDSPNIRALIRTRCRGKVAFFDLSRLYVRALSC